MPELTVSAPSGAHFEFEEVKTDKGTKSLGVVPILTWDLLDGAFAHYGDGVLKMVNGTSFKVSAQSIARRLKAAGKTDDEIAQAQITFKPGERIIAASTPGTRAAKAAKSASERVDGDALAKLLEKVASGEIDLASLGL